MKSFIGALANNILRAQSLVGSLLRTEAARNMATVGKDFRVYSEGRIYNIKGKQSRIIIGNHARIRGEITTFAHAGKIEIGDWFYCGPRSVIWSSDAAGIKIGNRALIAHDVVLLDTNAHPLDAQERFELTRQIMTSGHPDLIENIRSAPIVIGDDVWIGAGVTVLKGVSIGNRAVIGAGSIICADVDEGSLVPAGTILKRGAAR